MQNKSPAAPTHLNHTLTLLAQQVRDRKMTVPAILFLEAYKPMTTIFHSLSLISAPFFIPFFGKQFAETALHFFESRDNIEKFICMIEDHAHTQGKEES